ncbi:MAG TPA: hypothetical protein VFR97_12875 [Capillimicrobium sp.]|nr:hypothetical protein [Capillimicrobium sp.]
MIDCDPTVAHRPRCVHDLAGKRQAALTSDVIDRAGAARDGAGMPARPPVRRPRDGPACQQAAFEPGDDDRLVRAAFACPVCLRAAGGVRLVDAFAFPVGELSCRSCERLWQVELTLPQLLVLLTRDVAGLAVDAGPQAQRLRAAFA